MSTFSILKCFALIFVGSFFPTYPQLSAQVGVCHVFQDRVAYNRQNVCIMAYYAPPRNGLFDVDCDKTMLEAGRLWPKLVYLNFPFEAPLIPPDKSNTDRVAITATQFLDLLKQIRHVDQYFLIHGIFCGKFKTKESFAKLEMIDGVESLPGGFGDQNCCPAEMDVESVRLKSIQFGKEPETRHK